MPIIVRCQSCQKRLKIPDHLAGTVARCPACGASLRIPSLPAAAEPLLVPLGDDPPRTSAASSVARRSDQPPSRPSVAPRREALPLPEIELKPIGTASDRWKWIAGLSLAAIVVTAGFLTLRSWSTRPPEEVAASDHSGAERAKDTQPPGQENVDRANDSQPPGEENADRTKDSQPPGQEVADANSDADRPILDGTWEMEDENTTFTVKGSRVAEIQGTIASWGRTADGKDVFVGAAVFRKTFVNPPLPIANGEFRFEPARGSSEVELFVGNFDGADRAHGHLRVVKHLVNGQMMEHDKPWKAKRSPPGTAPVDPSPPPAVIPAGDAPSEPKVAPDWKNDWSSFVEELRPFFKRGAAIAELKERFEGAEVRWVGQIEEIKQDEGTFTVRIATPTAIIELKGTHTAELNDVVLTPEPEQIPTWLNAKTGDTVRFQTTLKGNSVLPAIILFWGKGPNEGKNIVALSTHGGALVEIMTDATPARTP